ncbi:hypothetical protein OEZ85_011041 [Tetradesmus obliquus]|uniref:Uncharacterized protein n=1 Tax=Tetradesmus obliquus TaxID=3088 RepID=A0ABY8TPB0_TETOB|nr:hypothetical protein OEZ85_011041 [Tetradesmus obliquus]
MHNLVFEAVTWLCIDSLASRTPEPVTWQGSQLARAFPKATTIIVRCKPSDQVLGFAPGPLVQALRLKGTLQQVLPCLERSSSCSRSLRYLGLEVDDDGGTIDLSGVLVPFADLTAARRVGALCGGSGSSRPLRRLDIECNGDATASVLDFASQHMEAGEMRHLRLAVGGAGGRVSAKQLLSWQRGATCEHHVECCIEQGGITRDMLQQLLLSNNKTSSYTLKSQIPHHAPSLSPDDLEFLVDCHVADLAGPGRALVYRVLEGGWFELCLLLKALG